MNYRELGKYIEALTNMANWTKTTFIRTFYKLKPHVVERKMEKLVAHQNIDNVFCAIEPDPGRSHNHLHMAIAGRGITRKLISKTMGVSESSVANVETIRSKKHMNQYIAKHLPNEQQYINGYHKIY